MFKKKRKVKKPSKKSIRAGFIGNADLLYMGEKRRYAVYQDGRCVSKDGKIIQITPDVLWKIKEEMHKKKKGGKDTNAFPSTSQNSFDDDVFSLAEDEVEIKSAPTSNTSQCTADDDWYEDDYDEDDFEDDEETISGHSLLKKVIATVTYFIVIGGTIYGSLYLLNQYESQVEIAQMAVSAVKDAEFTKDKVMPMKINQSAYKRLTESVTGDIILYMDADDYFGKFFTGDIIEGQFLTSNNLKKKKVFSNPWLINQSSDKELYTMPFDSQKIYNQLLFPGTEVRIRFVNANTLQDNNSIEDSEGSKPVNNTYEEEAKLFQKVTVVDMLNSNEESIYDIYSGLAIMSKEERTKMFNSLIKDKTASKYYQRFVPTSLVFALDTKQVETLSKIESNPDVYFKYTVLPSYTLEGSDEQNTLLYTYKEIAQEMADLFGDAAITGNL